MNNKNDKFEVWVTQEPYIGEDGIYKPIYAYAPEGIQMSYEMIISKEMFVEAYNRWIKEAED